MSNLTPNEELFLEAAKSEPNKIVMHTEIEGTNAPISSLKFIKLCVLNPTFNINVSKGDGNTALHIGASKGKTEYVDILLTSNAIKAGLSNGKNKTAAKLASQRGDKGMALKITNRYTELNGSDTHMTALNIISIAKAERITEQQAEEKSARRKAEEFRARYQRNNTPVEPKKVIGAEERAMAAAALKAHKKAKGQNNR